MNKFQICIPENIKYLIEYPELTSQLPPGQIILDKQITGCGATTLFLADNVPTILCSPRNELMYCKAESSQFKGKVYQFRTKDDKNTSVIDLENRMMKYISKCQSYPYMPVKILVSYDSFKHVAQKLHADGTLFQYRVIVDEAHTLFTDAAFKGGVEMEFLRVLQHIKDVIYVSATPFIEKYLEQIPMFANLPYVELIWPKSAITPYNIVTDTYYQGSIVKTASRIIDGYRESGYFAEKLVNGVPAYSREVVFFLNDVRTVLSVVKKNSLTPMDTNIICADNEDNENRLAAVGFTIGHSPKENEPHRTFTFATKCSFEGVDFNSASAYTYIFSDVRQGKHLHIDCSIDLVQCLGRQRNQSNPFRYDATFYYRTSMSFSQVEEEEYVAGIQSKLDLGKKWCTNFSQADKKMKNSIAQTLRRDQEKMQFAEHYATVVDDPVKGTVDVIPNDLVMYSEIRAWELQKVQYQSIGTVLGSISDSICSIAEDPNIAAFLQAYKGDYEARLKVYCDFLAAYPGYKERLEYMSQIPMQMKQAFNTLGPDQLRALSYVQADIDRQLQWWSSSASVEVAVRRAFMPGHFYTNKEVKEQLQRIFDIYCPGRTAKATDITGFIPCTPHRQSTGGRENGYLIGQYQ